MPHSGWKWLQDHSKWHQLMKTAMPSHQMIIIVTTLVNKLQKVSYMAVNNTRSLKLTGCFYSAGRASALVPWDWVLCAADHTALGSGKADDLVSAHADVSPTTASFQVTMPGQSHTHTQTHAYRNICYTKLPIRKWWTALTLHLVYPRIIMLWNIYIKFTTVQCTASLNKLKFTTGEIPPTVQQLQTRWSSTVNHRPVCLS